MAEAQVDLKRVRDVRSRLLQKALSDPSLSGLEEAVGEPQRMIKSMQRQETGIRANNAAEAHVTGEPRPEIDAERQARILIDLSRALKGLGRYERRALSRRKFAIRELDAARGDYHK